MHAGRWSALVVAALAVASVTAPGPVLAADLPDACQDASPAPFADRDRISVVHRAAVDCLWHLGVVDGRTDADGRHFDPSAQTTRGQFVALLHDTLVAVGAGDRLPPPQRPRFDDVPAGHHFDAPVHVLAATGIVEGVDAHRFEADRALRRDQAASLLVRAAGWSSERTLRAASGPHFGDVGAAHGDAVDAGFEFGLVEGTRAPCGAAVGRFSPHADLHRQQAASLLVRLIGVHDTLVAGGGGDRRGDAACPEPVWEPDITAAVDYGRQRSGSISLAAIGTDGVPVGYRDDTPVPAASVLKVMYLVAWLDSPDVRDRDLGAADRDLLEPMIHVSANDPATHIADQLGPDAMEALADRIGMREFAYTRPWGLTATSARDQASFLLEVDRHVPARHRAYALRLLTEVVPEQRWGIGEVATPGWTAHFKGGWGSGTGAMDHQVVLLRHDATDARVALAVMTTDNPSHAYGTATLRGVFEQLLADLP